MSAGLLPMLPVDLVDIAGSASMIALSILCFRCAAGLKRKEPQNVIWTFLVWFSSGLLIFALSRSVGHILKHMLVAMDLGPAWEAMRPISGSMNTIAFILVGSITLFFSRVYRIYRRMLEDKASIERAHEQIAGWNVNLESMVRERTRDLSESEEKYRRLFEDSKDMLFICDIQGKFRDINHTGVELLGLKRREDAIDRNLFLEWMRPVDAEKVRFQFGKHGFIKDMELMLKREGSEDLTVLFSGTAVYGKGEEPVEVEGTVKDITGRKQMELQLLQADKLASLGQLSAGIAHEINNPLGLVLGYTKLILKEEGTEPYKDDLKIIEKHALNCKKIVQNLLKFSRATSTARNTVDLRDLIQDVVQMVGNEFMLKGVAVETHFGPDLPKVEVDPDKMRQVFMNILMNGRQAIDGAGKITIRADWDRGNNRVYVRFRDDGSGIRPEIIHKIFDPFFTTKPTGMGTGLGLAVSYGIVKDHDGEIRVESTPGQGSMFTVDLPVRGGGRAGADQEFMRE